MEREFFHLESVEQGKFGGLSVSYSITANGIEQYKTEQGRMEHPDLRALLNQYRERAEFALGFPHQDENEDERYLVNPVGYFVKDDESFVLSVAVAGPVGTYKVKTPKLLKSTEEDERFTLLEDEVFAYLFEGKSAQLSIFGDEPDGVFDE